MPDLATTLPPAGLPPIKGFIETSFLDWRGQIAAVLFLPGCNFACPFCHNFTLVSDPDSLLTLPLEGVLDRLRPFVGWIDGVVISGGEPTLHPGLERLLGEVKQAGFKVKLDSNGYRPEALTRIVERGLADMVAMDLKAPLEPLAYRRACGKAIEVERVAESLEFIKTCGVAHEFRSTICPTWHGPAELERMAEAVEGCQAWTLQAMNPATGWNQEALDGVEMYNAEELARLQAEVADPVCRP
ncbi:MAG: anaerobic ribonucleoside-triphosphate reductase activating protein [Desulfarculaceae bacterium]|nr:anaerobic ribonucleoside-triphosphate reductase activating protein [Desulfarculaceae bacterium]MCF8070855.1 anaerobic ribonucleoside-triphosphate reductase activating protein [Desulfarculaceae bacterium]MCF8102293.1 anaerobic ribonucleoside-triphosphate reductase activating protein [Desulfarculaceae bacterium]MCF8118024.1 anaerobic ribonucleoside-triphosphate reductase activating protein [Desulfarculaceae bacterium]